jgi:ribosome-binding protein aMBF1 (putative translation factor)
MTKANMFKYGIAALLLLANVNIHGAPLTGAVKDNLQQQLDSVEKDIAAAMKAAQSKTFASQVALAKKINERNSIKRKLAGRS